MLFHYKTSIFSTIIAIMFISISQPVFSKIAIQHIGSNDPATEGWVYRDSFGDTSPNSGVAEGGVETTASGTHEYWRIQDSDQGPGAVHDYLFFPTNVADFSSDWELRVSLRVVSSLMIPVRNLPSINLIVSDGHTLWGVAIGEQIIGFVSNTNNLIHGFNQDMSSDYVNIRMKFFHNGDGIQDDVVNLYVNDVLVAKGVTRSELFSTTDHRVLFGGGTQDGVGDAHFEFVGFDTGPNAPVAIAGTSFDVNSKLQLDASLSYDNDGDALEYSWHVNDEFLSNGITTPIDTLSPGQYNVTLSVFDGSLSSSDTMLLAIPEPVIIEKPGEPSVVDYRNLIIELKAVITGMDAESFMRDKHKHHKKYKGKHKRDDDDWDNKFHTAIALARQNAFMHKLDRVIRNLDAGYCSEALENLYFLEKKTNSVSAHKRDDNWITDDNAQFVNGKLREIIGAVVVRCL